MKGKKRRRVDSGDGFELHTLPPSADGPSTLPPSILRHIQFSAGERRQLSAKTEFFATPPSPSKKSAWVDPDWNLESVCEGPLPTDCGDVGFVDPAYIDYLEDCAEEPGKEKRTQPPSVSAISF
jgi:hypothetical protein